MSRFEETSFRISAGNTLKLFEKFEIKEFSRGAPIVLSGYLSSRSVALLLRPEGDLYVGSGVCVQIGDRHLVVTAKHNLRHDGQDLSISDLEIRARGKKYGAALQVRSMGLAPQLDLAWLELDPKTVARPHLSFVTLDEIASLDEDKGQQACVLLGYPAETAETPSDAKQALLLESACVVTLSIRPADRQSPSNANSFCIEWPPRDRSLDDILPAPNGVSGGGVWLLPKHDEYLVWSPERTRLIGIETGWWKDYRELVVERIEYWLGLVADPIPELNEKIGVVLE
jgi:hypothetical protein